ncbi:GntR family transcriptional regulator [Glaciihabitans tibetensis]|uniref:GntR family transcriptional regulator n=1 Tax=Glaciihabitans tibetensis TaxID=1266600 RepID=A0A2T0VCH4_9MICO|nr:GntR family transcriptional regulator [Glaciihabitans tibetensis]PRY67871.1 GntR family transcriptional regulator [Glaciihabitans tibetensis]
MALSLDPNSTVPPFEQLRVQLVAQIADGSLLAGTRLPTVRGLADELNIAPNTVLRAYRELEADGFLESRGRNGTFVNARADVAEQQAQLAARAYADRVQQLGISPAAALAYVTTALK